MQEFKMQVTNLKQLDYNVNKFEIRFHSYDRCSTFSLIVDRKDVNKYPTDKIFKITLEE